MLSSIEYKCNPINSYENVVIKVACKGSDKEKKLSVKMVTSLVTVLFKMTLYI